MDFGASTAVIFIQVIEQILITFILVIVVTTNTRFDALRSEP